ncbi:MAG TPA: hypothetical protein VJL87_00145 [Bdellovibrionota bacterium]|nr:hypothetical protein [Bdellovibrionota bacterium]
MPSEKEVPPIQDEESFDTEGSDKTSEAQPGIIADMMRKIALTSLGAIFMTEETIRQTLGDMKLPKELLSKVLSNANKGKEELMKAFSKEVKTFLSNFNLQEEVEKFLETHDMKIEAKISFKPKDK